MKNFLKILLITILIFPCIFAFSGCSCSTSGNSNNNKTNSNIAHTVHFYTGTSSKYNIPNIEVKDGEIIPKEDRPNTDGWWYYDETEKVNKTFGDWYSDPSLDIKYVWLFDTDKVYGELTLYAKWNPVPTV